VFESIHCKNLSVIDSQGRKLLDNFNFQLSEGKIHALVGGSGSGKSTFCFAIQNLLLNNLTLEFEEFLILGVDFKKITNWKQWRGKEICYIPQNPADSFHPYFTLKTQILDTFKEIGVNISKLQIIDLLEKFGIKNPEEKLEKSPFSLSGGERQRVLIAISSFIQPKIIIADEPTTALDSLNERIVLKDLIGLISAGNTSLLLITHDRRIVRELADEVTVLKSGERVEHFFLNNRSLDGIKEEYSKKLLL
jgi:peptide/nickel transport system ATP-binding protein